MPSTVVDTLTQGYEAWNSRDIEAGVELLHPDIEWRPPPESPFAGPYRGRAEVRRFFRSMLEAFEELRREPLEFIERGDKVIVPVRSYVRGAGSGVGVTVSVIDVWELRDGRAISYEIVPDTPEVRLTLGLPLRGE